MDKDVGQGGVVVEEVSHGRGCGKMLGQGRVC